MGRILAIAIAAAGIAAFTLPAAAEQGAKPAQTVKPGAAIQGGGGGCYDGHVQQTAKPTA